MGYNDFYAYSYGPSHIFGFIISVIVWIAIIALVVALVKRFMCHGGKCKMRGEHKHGHCCGSGMWGGEDDAIKVLKERYAKGEIERQEYEERKHVLLEDK